MGNKMYELIKFILNNSFYSEPCASIAEQVNTLTMAKNMKTVKYLVFRYPVFWRGL